MFKYKGVVIRPIEERDLPRMVRLRSDPQVWRHLGNVEMVNREQQLEWYRSLRRDSSRRYYTLFTPRIPFLGIVRTDEIDRVNRSVRIGGDIAPRYQGRGYGSLMFDLLKKYEFDYLNMNRLWLLVLKTNTVALRLYRKAGFVEEGRQREAIFRDGRHVDYLMMSLLRSEYEKSRDSR
jgi:UDP-4-amino-4,6-dideoxy-N-acetyl-beta-L-altrosamine N-acetyltransferase